MAKWKIFDEWKQGTLGTVKTSIGFDQKGVSVLVVGIILAAVIIMLSGKLIKKL